MLTKLIDKFFSVEKRMLREYCDDLLLENNLGYEERLQSFYQLLLTKGDTAIDVGAHSGRHSIPLAFYTGDRGQVYAFEVLEDPIQQLLSKIGQYKLKNINLKKVALSNFSGFSEFNIAIDRPEESGILQRTIYNGPTKIKTVKVQVNTLDSFNFASIKFIKIDTEGAEHHVLKGSKETIIKNKPIIAFEFGASSYAAYDIDPKDTFEFFENLNYVVLNIFGDVLDEHSFIEASRAQTYWDYVACYCDNLNFVQSILKNYKKREVQ